MQNLARFVDDFFLYTPWRLFIGSSGSVIASWLPNLWIQAVLWDSSNGKMVVLI